jgi:hypothetical protein
MLHRPLGRRRLGYIIRAPAKIFIGGGEATIHRSYSGTQAPILTDFRLLEDVQLAVEDAL